MKRVPSPIDPYAQRRWARFGVDQDGIKYIPVGGLCIMTYVVSLKEDAILVGRINGDKYYDYWEDEWATYVHRRFLWQRKWFVPSTFPYYGEDPELTAERIVKKMLRVPRFRFESVKPISYSEPSEYYPGWHHWHICFAYFTGPLDVKKTPPWFRELRYVPLKKLRKEDVGVAGGPVVKALGLVK